MPEYPVLLQTPQSYSPHLSSFPPLSLYIHIPWCIRKCPYCDFNSHQLKQDLDEQAYIAALLTDLETELPYFWGRPVHTIFIGGGTPSLISAAAFEQLLSGIRARVNLLPTAEITLEANPGTFERNRFAGFAAAGINRLSIGVQSFADDKLTTLGRIHSSNEALSAIESGLILFPKVNIDLMYALPDQTIKQAEEDIQTAIATGVQHISAYQLTLEPNTPFAHTPPPLLPDDDHIVDIEETVHTALQRAGFTRYETSAFAQPQQECQHNLNYWQFGDYIGIGAGAHGKISTAQAIERTTRSRHPKDYLQAMQQQPQHAITRRQVSVQDLPFEFMLNALRLTAGVPSTWFSERTGLPLASIQHTITEAVERGLLDTNPLYLRPTALGRSFLNDLLALFLKSDI
ncbi:YggW family oxidoreductase [Snodgrassella communis]|uniref:Heme chaperone HemW n=1 Tax=Snodgrassella communis TaxID=2946699 RepID=A0A066TIQ1_9NEIS|nr:radical SAM family heme chaperone HemW [Snodgrassella communis]KDN11943.1 radical SAM enzyme, RdgB family [Snodgrassella communis]KDN14807.1 radical SAM family enzyme, RdgB family [Snodgrassella communis]PIT07485.1 YggW family oxidoreductase [Snodgrassella communis]PIT28110.1 YggW family oxidoreductase [Snodgrassella communis]PIT37974.1 YggW family oxidoreductase [Snodgrassella communis]